MRRSLHRKYAHICLFKEKKKKKFEIIKNTKRFARETRFDFRKCFTFDFFKMILIVKISNNPPSYKTNTKKEKRYINSIILIKNNLVDLTGIIETNEILLKQKHDVYLFQ